MKIFKLLFLASISFFSMTSCSDEEPIQEVTSHKEINIDYQTLADLEEQYLQEAEVYSEKISYHSFEDETVVKFSSVESLEDAARLVHLQSVLNNKDISIHEKYRDLDMSMIPPSMLSFVNADGKLIVGDFLYDIQDELMLRKTDLVSNETITENIIIDDNPATKKAPEYHYRDVYNSLGGVQYYGVSVSHFRVQLMQNSYRIFGARKGRARTSLYSITLDNGFTYIANKTIENLMCNAGLFFWSKVQNPRDWDDGDGCPSAQATCKRKKNTGVSSYHTVQNSVTTIGSWYLS